MQTTRRPSTAWFWGAAGLALVGLVGAAVWGFLTYRNLQNRLDELPRTDVPGQVSFEVTEPQGMTVYYEDPDASGTFAVRASNRDGNTLAVSPVDVTITGPSGPVGVADYETDLRFDVDGRVATALATFEAPAAGTYRVDVVGDVPTAARVSVGDVVDLGLLANAAGAVVLFVGTILAAGVIVLVAVKRTRPPTSTGEDARPLARV